MARAHGRVEAALRLAEARLRQGDVERQALTVVLHGAHERVDDDAQLLLDVRQHAGLEGPVQHEARKGKKGTENDRGEQQQAGLDARFQTAVSSANR